MSKFLDTVASQVKRLSLASLPSPIRKLDALSHQTGIPVFVKEDGLNSTRYGGNKVRKLEFLLAEAVTQEQNHIVTLGSAGSNHAVATSTYAQQLGMRCTVCLVHQPPSAIVQKNLLRHLTLGTSLKMFEKFQHATAHAAQLAEDPRTGLIPLGGSSPLATLGFVFAAAELAEQVQKGDMPLPDRIYLACGTMGTAAGLCLGMKLLGLPVQVIAVRVTEKGIASPALFARLYAESVAYLDTVCPSLKIRHLVGETPDPEHFMFSDDFFGQAYGIATAAGIDAIEQASKDNLTLDLTYTAKAMSALIAHAKSGQLKGKTCLFWHTLNALDTPFASVDDYRLLGPEYERYFDGEIA